MRIIEAMRSVNIARRSRWCWWAVPTLLMAVVMPARVASAGSEVGRDIYMQRCLWCHGEEGRGDGASAVGMFPRPRDFVRADYKIRSTAHGQLPTDDDLFDVISRGLPGTPMTGWEKILSAQERRNLVDYLKSLSPRFEVETPESIRAPSASEGSTERGEEVYDKAKCFLCHGDAGRGDGAITTTLNYAWGLPHAARDFTRGWTFKGGHEPGDIYLRITGGLNGTPMGPYRDLLTDQERWDLAYYVASLDTEPSEMSADFVVTAALIEGAIPHAPDSPQWREADSIVVPLAGQVVLDPPLRWWIPTTGSLTVRSLWNGTEVAFLLEWHDPTGPEGSGSAASASRRAGRARGSFPDSAFLQFPADENSKPYFLFGDSDNAVQVWHWQAGPAPVAMSQESSGDRAESNGDLAEGWGAVGSDKIDVRPARFEVSSHWQEGRWQVIFRQSLAGQPKFEPGKFVPVVFSVRDGANGEIGNNRAVSTWLYATLERPKSARPWLIAIAYFFGAVIGELWILSRLNGVRIDGSRQSEPQQAKVEVQ